MNDGSDGVSTSTLGEADAHIVHRLESFSDIVFGFSLAQVGVSLALPKHAMDILRHPTMLFSFAITFAMISAIWWVHARVFRHYFHPTRLAIVLNFVVLGLTILLVYTLEIFTHTKMPSPDYSAATRLYFGTFAFTFGALACLSAVGLHARWEHLSERLRRVAFTQTFRSGTGSVFILTGIALSLIPSVSEQFRLSHGGISLQGALAICFGIGALLGRVGANLAYRLAES